MGTFEMGWPSLGAPVMNLAVSTVRPGHPTTIWERHRPGVKFELGTSQSSLMKRGFGPGAGLQLKGRRKYKECVVRHGPNRRRGLAMCL
jgi:hypothetical protein